MDMRIDHNETIEYYDNNAKEYFDRSVAVDMTHLYREFLKYVPTGGSILDIGCGSGRDLKFFKEQGYEVEGLEASTKLKELASEYSECHVFLDRIQDFKPTKKYDALWACASLLHLRQNELIEFFKNIDSILQTNGIICISMKSGINTGMDELGRYFTNFDDTAMSETLCSNNRLQVINNWISDDGMSRTDFYWSNVILRLTI